MALLTPQNTTFPGLINRPQVATAPITAPQQQPAAPQPAPQQQPATNNAAPQQQTQMQNTSFGSIKTAAAPGMMQAPKNPIQPVAPITFTRPPNAMNNNAPAAPAQNTTYTAPPNAMQGNPAAAPITGTQQPQQQQQNTANMQQQGGQTFQAAGSAAPISNQNSAATPPANLNLSTPQGSQFAAGAPSLEQSALNGGGAGNKQQISNFLTALNQAGAGGNNGFQNATQPGQQPISNLVDPNAAMQNNGSVAGVQSAANTAQTNPNSLQGGNGYGVNTQMNGNQGQSSGINVAPSQASNTTATLQAYLGAQTPTNAYLGAQVPTQAYLGAQTPTQAYLGAQTPTQAYLGAAATAPAPYSGASDPLGGVTGGPVYPASTTGNPVTGSPITPRQGQQLLGVPTPQPAGNPDTGSPIPVKQGKKALVSDENLKTGIKDGQYQVQDFLSKIGAHSYEYKHPEQDGVGRFTSPMAQELEKTELGKQAVINTPRGKMVDYGRLGGVNLAASSVLYREQQRLQNQINDLIKRISVGKKK